MRVDAVSKGRAVSVAASGHVDALHEHVYDLLANPLQHVELFEDIQEASAQLLESGGGVSTWAVDYKTKWRFMSIGGVADTPVRMVCDRDAGTIRFGLRQPGFLKVYEGQWAVTPSPLSAGGRPGTLVTLAKTMQPSLAPPFPFNKLLKRQIVGQVTGMMAALGVHAAKTMQQQQAAEIDQEAVAA